MKIWVDDRDGKYKKLTPDLYGRSSTRRTRAGSASPRTSSRSRMRRDCCGRGSTRLRTACATGYRRRGLALFKEHPNLVVVPNLPDRGVAADMSWLSDSVPADELKKLQAGATDRPEAQKAFGIQARNLAKINAAGVKIVLGTDGGVPWSHHVEMADMVAAGMTPAESSWPRRRTPPSSCGWMTSARLRPARAPISSCSTPTRSTTSRTHARSPQCTCAAPRSIAQPSGPV